jgi:alkylhydroperoxidase family enzyme
MSWDPPPSARGLAPSAFSAWDTFTTQASAAVDPSLIAVIEDRIAVLFDAASRRPSGRPEVDPELERSCAEAVEQFVIDVAALTDMQRDAVFAALGRGTYPFFQTVYAYYLNFRLVAALSQLFDEPDQPRAAAPGQRRGEAEDIDLWPALDRFLTVVAALDELDPLTTELVRLRVARAHNCRICQSRRNVDAVTGGADESTFDKVDFYESSDLDERHKVALRLTDALLWRPADYPDGLVTQVRETFRPAETIEIVLDVVRNAANKVAVALQADQAVVASGVEYFSITADGTLAYGLQGPIGASAR